MCRLAKARRLKSTPLDSTEGLLIVGVVCHRWAGGETMAKNSKLTNAAVKIGSAVGKLDGNAHRAARKASEAAQVARKELAEISRQLDALKKQLEKSSKRLQSALKG